MAGKNPREAIREFTKRFEETLKLLGPLVVKVSSQEVGPGNLTVLPMSSWKAGQDDILKPIPLKNANGATDLLLFATMKYELVHIPGSDKGPYKVTTTEYIYDITDCGSKKLISFHYHPDGPSRAKGYHLHVEGAQTVRLSLPGTGNEFSRELSFGKIHLPTKRILIEDVVEILRDEFSVRLVESRRRSANKVLEKNRRDFELGKTHG